MEKVLIDTCIFIDIFRGNREYHDALKTLNGVICSVIHMELIQGCRNAKEVRVIDNYLSIFEIRHLDNDISMKALELMRRYSKSHGLIIPDALIAATAIVIACPLFTLNVRDFKFIKGVEIWRIR